LTPNSSSGVVTNPKSMEQEKRIRREIANSNERRRMQSINSGFANLRTLLPHHEGEKLSKASILQQTADYIYSLEQEKTRLLSQNCQLKRLLGQTQHLVETDETDSAPAPKRRLVDTGQKLLLEDDDDITEIQNKLDKERRTRMGLEERVRGLEHQLYSNNRKQIIQRYSTEEVTEESGTIEYQQQQTPGQTVLTPAAKKQGLETLVIDSGAAPVAPAAVTGGKLPSIIHCVKGGEGGRLEVGEIAGHTTDQTSTALEIANIQDPETGVTRQYIVTTGMCDTTSKQNLETIVEAIRHLEGDHLFSEEAGPHEVVKEEVVESCIIEENGAVLEVTGLPACSSINTINLPQFPVPNVSTGSSSSGTGQSSYQLTVSLPTVPVASMQNQSAQVQVPVSVTNLISSLQQPLAQTPSFLPQVPVSLSSVSLPPVSSLSCVSPPAQQSTTLPGVPVALELTQQAGQHIAPPQTSPVNLELGGGTQASSGNVTPTSELNEINNSPPQSSPVNLAQSNNQNIDC